MRNHELIKKIWSIVNMKSPSPSTKLIAIENLIRKERPESKEDNFWKGGYIKKETNL